MFTNTLKTLAAAVVVVAALGTGSAWGQSTVPIGTNTTAELKAEARAIRQQIRELKAQRRAARAAEAVAKAQAARDKAAAELQRLQAGGAPRAGRLSSSQVEELRDQAAAMAGEADCGSDSECEEAEAVALAQLMSQHQGRRVAAGSF